MAAMEVSMPHKTAAVAALLVTVMLGALACGDAKARAPSTSPTTVVQPQSMTISGRTSLGEPGETSQLTLVATFADGTTKEMGAGTIWSAGPTNVVSITPGGLLNAVAYGSGRVTARYGSVPMLASANVRVVPEGMFIVTGYVKEGGFAVADARIEASSPGRILTTVTNVAGFYTLVPVAGGVSIRAERSGFVTQIKPVGPGGDQQLDFDLQRMDPFATVDGVYALTVTASSSCTTLPPEVMHRTYPAQVSDRQGKLSVVLQGDNFLVWGEPGFTGSRDGPRATFTISDDLDADYYILEQVGADRYLSFAGTAVGEISDKRIAATFDGRIYVRHLSPSGGIVAECRASDHRLEFVR
jgi:hypothetical protein